MNKDPIKLVSIIFKDIWDDYGELGQAEIYNLTESDCKLLFNCPGCGKIGSILIGFNVKPSSSPSWLLVKGNLKDLTTWTLQPSIHCMGCCGWHGYLQNGIFVHCK